MTTETDKLMEDVAAVLSFLETFKDKEYGTLKEEVERLSAQITESARASKRAALLRQVESTARGARVAFGKYRGFDEFDLMISNEVLRLAKSGGTDGKDRISPRAADEWRSSLGQARGDLYESIGRALDSTTPGAGDELTFTGETSEMWRDVHLATSVASLFRPYYDAHHAVPDPLRLRGRELVPGHAQRGDHLDHGEDRPADPHRRRACGDDRLVLRPGRGRGGRGAARASGDVGA